MKGIWKACVSLRIASSKHGIHSCLGNRKIQLFGATFVNHQQLISETTRPFPKAFFPTPSCGKPPA